MRVVICMGIQATGKSTFSRERLYDTHVRLNLDMLRTRRRERLLFDACLAAKQPVVIDNTNPTVADRARYIAPARAQRFEIVGYYFQSQLQSALQRNAARPEKQRIREAGLRAVYTKLELPSLAEGFDSLYYVQINDGEGGDGFDVKEWNSEIQ